MIASLDIANEFTGRDFIAYAIFIYYMDIYIGSKFKKAAYDILDTSTFSLYKYCNENNVEQKIEMSKDFKK